MRPVTGFGKDIADPCEGTAILIRPVRNPFPRPGTNNSPVQPGFKDQVAKHSWIESDRKPKNAEETENCLRSRSVPVGGTHHVFRLHRPV